MSSWLRLVDLTGQFGCYALGTFRMADGPSGRPSYATVWRQLRAGDPVGSPTAEWAYVTPRFPDGISGSQLRRASAAVQAETGRLWFLLNYEPYRLRPGTYFGFDPDEAEPASDPAGFSPDLDMSFGGPLGGAPIGAEPVGGGLPADGGSARQTEERSPSGVRIGGFGHPFAPSPLRAEDILRQQFGENLSEGVLRDLADELGDNWIERDPDPILGMAIETGLSQTKPEAMIAAVSEYMRSQLDVLAAVPSNYGHNEGGGRSLVVLDTEAFKQLLDRVEQLTGVSVYAPYPWIDLYRMVWSVGPIGKPANDNQLG